jgi:hypothetical protein
MVSPRFGQAGTVSDSESANSPRDMQYVDNQYDPNQDDA